MGLEAIGIVLMLAVIVEAVVEAIKGWVPERAPLPEGVSRCAAQVDVLAIAGIRLNMP